jgi:protocatechuate 3,4-dioxygenase beta subunit
MPTFRTFNDVTDSSLLFTNIGVYEADIGNLANAGGASSFVISAPEPVGAPGSLTTGMQWTTFSSRVTGANSQKTLEFEYNATNTNSSQLITSFNSLYTVDLFSGPGVSVTAIERVYDTQGNLLGTQTYIKGQPNPAAVTLVQGQQQVRVTLSIIEAIDGTGDNTSAIDMSLIRQTFISTPVTQLCTIGDYVWIDMNANGLQDSGDFATDDVTVHLTNADGSMILATTTTDSTGHYLFDHLQAGTYAIQFESVDGFHFTTQGVGADRLLDSDANIGTGLTAAVTLSAGQTYLGLDAGLVINGSGSGTLASVGDYVWLDTDRDGIQDSNESGLEGVTVNLLNSLGTVIATDITDTAGAYSFVNLQAGAYQVEFVALSGYGRSTANAGADGVDSDADVGTGKTASFTLAAGEVNNTVDSGMYVLPASIGNYVWLDTDRDGIQDANESGLANVTVRLLNSVGSVIDTAITNGSGLYAFNNLTAGTYQVQFVTPTNYGLTQADADLNLSDDVDSDADVGTGLTQQITLIAGEANDTIDAGMYVLPASIGNYVWIDSDQDGLQDANESGLANVTVRLLNSTGGVITTTTTDGNGLYTFNNLTAGTYQIQFVTPTNYVLTTANAGLNLNDSIDSDAVAGTGLTQQVTLAAGQNNETLDAGMVFCPPANGSIGNFVWYDCNNNGKQDSGENGLSGVTVKLMAADGTTVLSTTTTSSTGFYQFSNLTAGTYQVYFGTKSGYDLTAANQGTNDAIDSDASTSSRLTGPIALAAGENNTTVDAGMVVYCPPAPASIGNFVWYDCNNNGKQDSGESGLSGVTVKLMAADGTTVLATTTTSSSGAYQFSNLAAGTYQVYFGTKSGYDLAAANQGTNDSIDSDANTTTRLSGPVTLAAGENNTTVDAGMVVYCPPAPASIGNFVWYDCDRDGQQDSGEGGLSGVTVKLMGADGTTVLATTTTSSSGYYQFSNLTAGTYQVYFGTKSGYDLTAANQGSNDSIDSDASTTTRLSGPVTLVAGENNTTVDAGMAVYCPPATASLGNFVWYDCNNDGKQNNGESGISGVIVNLMAADGATVLATTTTSSTGYYQFSNLAAGTYQVYFGTKSGYALTAANQGTDDSIDSDASLTTRLSGAIVLSAGENETTVDAGMVQYCPPPATGSIGNFVWNDCDKDGKQDSGEAGISGVAVKLMASNGTTVLATTTTSSTGFYQFTNLAVGTYQVYFGTKSGYQLTAANQGTSDSIDSDANTSTRLSGPIVLGAGVNDTSVDAGFYQTTSGSCDPSPCDTSIDGLTPGFWSTHLEAWDGASDTKYANLVSSGVLKSTDVLRSLPNQGRSGPGGAVGVLLGDVNANGVTDAGENTLFVSLKAAQQLVASSVSANDTRQILARHAIAAQLNIDNGDRAPGGTTVGADLISKAVSWLKGQGPFVYSDGSTGKVDVTGAIGVLDVGTSGSIDYNTSNAAFTSASLSSSKMAWQQDKALGLASTDFYVSGEELKDALQAFNENRLVTSADGSKVGWSNGYGMTNIHTNNATGAWTVLRDAGVI